jgi:hypothetical protein
MLSLDESKLPSLFILVPPNMVHAYMASKDGLEGLALAEDSGATSMMIKLEGKVGVTVIYFLLILCQLTGKVMHTPIKLRFPAAKAAAVLKDAAGPMKVAFALLKLGMVAAKVATGGCLPFPFSCPISMDQLTEMSETFEALTETGGNMMAFAEAAIENHELGEEVRTPALPLTRSLILA